MKATRALWPRAICPFSDVEVSASVSPFLTLSPTETIGRCMKGREAVGALEKDERVFVLLAGLLAVKDDLLGVGQRRSRRLPERR